mgnify:CR=1 FL=1
MSSIQTAEKEVIRQEILEMLSMAAEGGAGEKVLRAALKKAGYELTEEEILRQISYLKDKGLVRAVEVKNPGMRIRRTIAYITAAGTDYLEGNGGEIPGINEG